MFEFVPKYHVELPQEFIEHALSEEGQAWLKRRRQEEKERLEEVDRKQQKRMENNETTFMLQSSAHDIFGRPYKELQYQAILGTKEWWHFWEDEPDGRHAIVTEGARALLVDADVSFEELLRRFEEGERTPIPGVFPIEI